MRTMRDIRKLTMIVYVDAVELDQAEAELKEWFGNSEVALFAPGVSGDIWLKSEVVPIADLHPEILDFFNWASGEEA
jgi:hypothetical protein